MTDEEFNADLRTALNKLLPLAYYLKENSNEYFDSKLIEHIVKASGIIASFQQQRLHNVSAWLGHFYHIHRIQTTFEKMLTALEENVERYIYIKENHIFIKEKNKIVDRYYFGDYVYKGQKNDEKSYYLKSLYSSLKKNIKAKNKIFADTMKGK